MNCTAELPSPPRLRAAEVLREMLKQHESMRALLASALVMAAEAKAGDLVAVRLLPHLAYAVRCSLERHLAHEEEALLPILLDDPPLGPQRAEVLIAEHERQRREIERLTAPAADPGAWLGRATALIQLVSEFLADMDEEEQSLLRPDVVRDELGAVDQCSG